MKRFTSLLLFASLTSIGQDLPQEVTPIVHYPTFELGVGKANGHLENAAPHPMFMFRFDYVVVPRRVPALEFGAQLGFLPVADVKHNVSGVQINSSTLLGDISLLTRVRPAIKWDIKPFLDVSFGIGFSATSSSYEVVDEATFWEELLLGAEDEYSTQGVKEFTDRGALLGFGLGLEYKGIVYLHGRYSMGGEVGVVSREGINVANEEIQYDVQKSTMRYYTIGVGLNLNKMLQKSRQMKLAPGSN